MPPKTNPCQVVDLIHIDREIMHSVVNRKVIPWYFSHYQAKIATHVVNLLNALTEYEKKAK